MKTREVLELSIDLAYPQQETVLAIRAILDRMRTKEDQIALLRLITLDIEAMLKGAEEIAK